MQLKLASQEIELEKKQGEKESIQKLYDATLLESQKNQRTVELKEVALGEL